jgi:hypothetical protein
MPLLLDAGVPLEALPWGSEGSNPVASRSIQCFAEDGKTNLGAYFAWDPAALSKAKQQKGATEGLLGVLVAHTAIGPQEVFVRSCCVALARIGSVQKLDGDLEAV